MALSQTTPSDLLFHGLPAALLVVALVRSVPARPKSALVYFALLAGWLGHWAVARHPASLLPAATRIETPDRLPATLQIAEVSDRSVLQLQAPAGLEWTLRGDERRMEFSYGLVPEAYERNETDGCGFAVSLRHDGVVRQVFYRLLQPRQRLEDRGVQLASVILPPVAPGEVLSLAIDVGPNGESGWDWVHLSGVSFTRSHTFLPAQFPSFQRLPETARSPYGSLFQNRQGPFFLQLHAPSVLEFVLHGEEKRMRFRYGFLPGAYQNGNATDGARFFVLLQPTTGAARTLWNRTLQPVAQATDRGPQAADISIDGFKAGDRLLVGVEPGPAGNLSFDWTYVSSLSLE